MARYAIVLDTRRCVGCHSCTVACKVHNDLPVDMIYNPVTTAGPMGVFPNVRMVHLPLVCMHCANPPCVECCPTGASQQREDGIVWVDETKCVGCKACVMACPYGARIPNHEKGIVQKCDFCMDRVTCWKRAVLRSDLPPARPNLWGPGRSDQRCLQVGEPGKRGAPAARAGNRTLCFLHYGMRKVSNEA
jgi:Fe-S-cluster-containing hydrogenase component 2